MTNLIYDETIAIIDNQIKYLDWIIGGDYNYDNLNNRQIINQIKVLKKYVNHILKMLNIGKIKLKRLIRLIQGVRV